MLLWEFLKDQFEAESKEEVIEWIKHMKVEINKRPYRSLDRKLLPGELIRLTYKATGQSVEKKFYLT